MVWPANLVRHRFPQKIDDAQLRELRRKALVPGATVTGLAREYGLSISHVSDLLHCHERPPDYPYEWRKPVDWIARFLQLVEKTAGCWFWKGPYLRGHGRASFRGKRVPAKTVSYVLFIGEVPAGRAPYQTCGDKRCVRPEHLALRSRYTGRWMKSVRQQAAA